MIAMVGEPAAKVQHFVGLLLTLDGLTQILYGDVETARWAVSRMRRSGGTSLQRARPTSLHHRHPRRCHPMTRHRRCPNSTRARWMKRRWRWRMSRQGRRQTRRRRARSTKSPHTNWASKWRRADPPGSARRRTFRPRPVRHRGPERRESTSRSIRVFSPQDKEFGGGLCPWRPSTS